MTSPGMKGVEFGNVDQYRDGEDQVPEGSLLHDLTIEPVSSA